MANLAAQPYDNPGARGRLAVSATIGKHERTSGPTST